MDLTAIEFELNPQAKPQVLLVGQEHTPVIIIDDVCLNTKPIQEFAIKHCSFSVNSNSFYPGIRDLLPKDYVIKLLTSFYRNLYQIYNIPSKLTLTPKDTFFSLLNTPEHELQFLQRLPHFDTSRPFYFAVLHYLNEGPHGNTALFRHKPTQYERITDQRVDAYLASAEDFINKHGEPESKYFDGSGEHFEKIYEVEYKPNRLVIYPGNILHSIMVNVENDIDGNPKTGRLTANIFIEFE